MAEREAIGRASNVSAYLTLRAAERPEQPAIISTWSSPSWLRGFVPSWLAGSIDNRQPVLDAKGQGSTIDNSFVSFADLDQLVQRYAAGLLSAGFAPGMRVLLMLRPGVDFVATTFAMFRIGAVPVMIDPGMGVSRMLECVRQVDVQGFIGVPAAQVMRLLRPGAFANVRHVVTAGRRWGWGGATLAEWRIADREARRGMANGEKATPLSPPLVRGEVQSVPPEVRPRVAQSRSLPATGGQAHSPAAILFTSGSTGPAKGVVYEHSMFDAQVRMIQSQYGIEPGEIDLPTFPLFGLFSIAMGMTVVIPEMDASRPAKANPAKIVRDIQRYGVTNTFGSPALWRNVAGYCVEHGIKLPTLRRVLIAGAPVPWQTIEQLHAVLSPDADVHTPYGATEALPVSTIGGREVVSSPGRTNGEETSSGGSRMANGGHAWDRAVVRQDEPHDSATKAIPLVPSLVRGEGTRELTRRGAGICVGRPVPGTRVRIIRITDQAIATWRDDLLAASGEVGEIVVSGDVVTQEYFAMPEASALAKIRDGATIWHRMGDVAYVDELSRIWFCGRKAHRVETSAGTLFSVCCEAIFNEHPAVSRCALVGLGRRGRQTPVIVVEPAKGRAPRGQAAQSLIGELLSLAAANEQTAAIRNFLFRRSLPVDVRHNAKINRELLAAWAAKRMARAK